MKNVIISFLTLLTVLINQTVSQSFVISSNNFPSYRYTQQSIQKDKALKLLAEAERITRGEKHSSIRAELLSSIAVFYEKLGETEKSASLLTESRKLIEEKDDPRETCDECPGKTYYRILTAVNHAQAGQEKYAIEMLENLFSLVNNKQDKATAYPIAFLAELFAELGKKDRALELLAESLNLAKALENEYEKSTALGYIAKVYAKLNKLDSAMQVADITPKSPDRDKALIEIAKKYAAAGEFERAIKINSSVESFNFKPEIFIAVAEQYLKVGNKKRALASLREAVKANRNVDVNALQMFASNDIVVLFAKAEEYDVALKIAKRDNNLLNTELLLRFAPILARGGKRKVAESLIEKAFTHEVKASESLINTIKSAEQDVNGLKLSYFYEAARFQEIANIYLAIGNKKCASEILSRAVKILDSLTENEVGVFYSIAISYYNIGEEENAIKTIEKINDTDAYIKVLALLFLISRYTGASQVIDESEKISKILWGKV